MNVTVPDIVMIIGVLTTSVVAIMTAWKTTEINRRVKESALVTQEKLQVNTDVTQNTSKDVTTVKHLVNSRTEELTLKNDELTKKVLQLSEAIAAIQGAWAQQQATPARQVPPGV